MTTLYLVRHGETTDNVAKIIQGQTQGCLTEHGRLQAVAVRDKMAAEHFDAFISSDLKRAVDTATIIAGPHGQEVTLTPLLRERDWGGFTGRYIPDLRSATWPADIETLDCMMARAADFLTYIRTSYPDSKVLAVGHGIINKAIQAVCHGKQMNDIERMDNAEIRVLTL